MAPKQKNKSLQKSLTFIILKVERCGLASATFLGMFVPALGLTEPAELWAGRRTDSNKEVMDGLHGEAIIENQLPLFFQHSSPSSPGNTPTYFQLEWLNLPIILGLRHLPLSQDLHL